MSDKQDKQPLGASAARAFNQPAVEATPGEAIHPLLALFWSLSPAERERQLPTLSEAAE